MHTRPEAPQLLTDITARARKPASGTIAAKIRPPLEIPQIADELVGEPLTFASVDETPPVRSGREYRYFDKALFRRRSLQLRVATPGEVWLMARVGMTVVISTLV